MSASAETGSCVGKSRAGFLEEKVGQRGWMGRSGAKVERWRSQDLGQKGLEKMLWQGEGGEAGRTAQSTSQG